MTTAGMTRSEAGMTDWIKHGLIGGIIAGIVFAMFEMVMAAPWRSANRPWIRDTRCPSRPRRGSGS